VVVGEYGGGELEYCTSAGVVGTDVAYEFCQLIFGKD